MLSGWLFYGVTASGLPEPGLAIEIVIIAFMVSGIKGKGNFDIGTIKPEACTVQKELCLKEPGKTNGKSLFSRNLIRFGQQVVMELVVTAFYSLVRE